MSDMVEDFLNEAQKKLSDLEGLFPVLEKNPADEAVWSGLEDFFVFIRAVAPFAGFMRAYRLSDAGLAEINGYLTQESTITILPSVLMKFQRLKKIFSTAVNLKREPRESDEDLLSVTVEAAPVQDEVLRDDHLAVTVDLTAQEAALDEREEQLVLWARALEEQEKVLKKKENVLFEEERRQSLSQEKISAVMERLGEQEKLQADLENHLAETRLALQNCQEKLSGQKEQQDKTLSLLEAKNEALSKMDLKIQNLTALLGEKENISEQREEQLFRELQSAHRQAEDLQVSLQALEQERFEINQNHQKMSAQFETLEQEYRNVLKRLEVEKENTGLMLNEKRELEKQHIEFNTRFIALQDSLNIEKENLKRAELALERQKQRNDFIWGTLKAASWPYDAEKIQKDLAVLARRENTQKMSDSLSNLKNLVGNIRTRPFSQIPMFLYNFSKKTAKKYQRNYKIAISGRVDSGVDQDALDAVEEILSELTENAFRYAFPPENEDLKLIFSVEEEGAFLHFSFCDNGTFFDFDKLYAAVRCVGLTDENAAVDRNDLLVGLFHHAVRFHTQQRGLIKVAKILEKSGGQIYAAFDGGLRFYFSIPKKFLFDKVLLFAHGGYKFALPLNAVAETVFLQESEFGIQKQENMGIPFFYWKGMMLPVLNLMAELPVEDTGYGLVVRSGIFCALIPVQQILDTEHFLAFSDKRSKPEQDWLSGCTVLESGGKVFWIDLSKLWEKAALPLPKKIVSVQNESNAGEVSAGSVSYLVFKSEPGIFGAVPVDGVLRVEDFSFPPSSLVRKKYYETEGKRLPLKDSCPRDSYPYAQAVLIFDAYALAIQEVVDIIEVPDVGNGNIDFIVYRNRKVPVFKSESEV